MNIIQREQLLKKIIESPPDIPLKQILEEAGFSPSYSQQATRILNTKSFREHINEIITNEGVVATLQALLNRRECIRERFDINSENQELIIHSEKVGGVFPKIEIKTEKNGQWLGTGKSKRWVEEEIEYKELSYYLSDGSIADKALDKLFKLRGDYAPEEHNHNLLSPFIQRVQVNGEENNNPQITGGEK